MHLVTSARREQEGVIHLLRVRRAINIVPTNKELCNILSGQKVHFIREKGGLGGLYTFLYRHGRLIALFDVKDIKHLLHNAMIKTYTRPYLQ